MMKKALRFLAENGLYLFAGEVCRRISTRVRGRLLFPSLRAKGMRVGARSYIRGTRYMQVGNNFCIGDDVWIECLSSYRGHKFIPRIVIGSCVSISRWVHITCIEAIEIGSHTLIGSKVLIADHNHGSYSGPQQSSPDTPPAARQLGGGGSVIIEENVWIGDNVCVLGPSRIGRGAIIASNSVVCGDILANTIAGGIPARPLRQFDTSSKSWERR